MKIIILPLSILLSAFVFIGCNDDENPSQRTQCNGLGFAETEYIPIGDFTLTFAEVVEESRCPSIVNLDCFWAGRGLIKITLTENLEQEEFILSTIDMGPDWPQVRVTYKNFEITLIQLSPYPDANIINKEDYCAEIDVRRL